MFSIVWSRCDGLSKNWDKLSLPGNRTPDISARPWFGLFWQNLPQIVPVAPSGTQNGPFCPVAGPSTKKVVPQNFRNHFYRTEISPRFGFVPSNPPKGPKKYPNAKKGPKGGSIALGPPQLDRSNDRCESHVLANGRTKLSIDPQYLTLSRRLYPLLAPLCQLMQK